MTKKKFSSLHQGQEEEALIFIIKAWIAQNLFFLLGLQRQFQDDLQLV
jgi:hypothetical protein